MYNDSIFCLSLQQSERESQEVEKKLEATVHLLEEHLNKAHEDIHKIQEQYKQELERERYMYIGVYRITR